MLSINLKNYLQEKVQGEYGQIDVSKNNIQNLNEKIKLFEKMLEIEKDNERYNEKTREIVQDLERVAAERGKVDFNKVANIKLILEIAAEIAQKGQEKSGEEYKIFYTLKIINDENMLNAIFKVDNEGKLVKSIERIKEIESYLKRVKKQELIPYIRAYYFCENPEIFKEVEQGPIYDYWKYFNALIIAYIEISDKIREKILNEYIEKVLKIQEYLQNIIKDYEGKINFKYIPSSVTKQETYDELIKDNEDEKAISTVPFITINEDKQLKKIKLVGFAGVGKTTTLEYIEYQDACNYQEKGKIPVIINLITVEDKNETIEKLIARKLKGKNKEIKAENENSEAGKEDERTKNNNSKVEEEDTEIVEYLIQKNRINLYLDGVNEIRIKNNHEKNEFLDKIQKFADDEKNRNLKIIATDRDNNEESVLNNYKTFVIQKMTEEDIEKFIEGNAVESKKEEIKRQIKEKQEFLEDKLNPIMLKEIIKIVECGKKIPDNLQMLSKVYLNAIIDREINEQHNEDAKYINDILTYMVKETLSKENWTANAPTSFFRVISIFNRYAKEHNLENLDTIKLLELIQRLGILKEVEMEKYAFLDENYFHLYNLNANIETDVFEDEIS